MSWYRHFFCKVGSDNAYVATPTSSCNGRRGHTGAVSSLRFHVPYLQSIWRKCHSMLVLLTVVRCQARLYQIDAIDTASHYAVYEYKHSIRVSTFLILNDIHGWCRTPSAYLPEFLKTFSMQMPIVFTWCHHPMHLFPCSLIHLKTIAMSFQLFLVLIVRIKKRWPPAKQTTS